METGVSTDRFKLLVDAVQDYGIFMLDPDGMVVSWNIGAQRIKQYTREEIVGRHFSIFYPPDAVAAGWPDEELRRAKEFGRYEDEGWRLRKDGSRFWANVVLTAMWDASGTLTGYAKVTRDLTERRRLEELERSSQRMSEFLAMLAHELRNPLAPIRNAVSILQLEPTPSPMLKNSRDMIDRQLSHLTRLVDDLLDVGRLTTGKIHLKMGQLDYADLVDKCVTAMRPLVEAGRHRLTVDLPKQEIWVEGDATRLTQVLHNLMANAVKYTPEGGDIRLKVWLDGTHLYTTLSDTGVGMTPDALATVFTLFSQVDSAATGQSGLGIGLTLARSLVELHGGVLYASSAGTGLGSTFTVVLPRGHRLVPPGHVTRDARKLLLVCDDSRDSADSLSEVLRMLGFRVVTAYDGTSAEAALRDALPSAVFMDLSMPDASGFELLRRLKNLAGAQPLCAFAVTGYGSDEDKQRTKAAGFADHLTKPVGLDRLREALVNANLLAARPAGER